jgi:hypothetical protein|nr:MAG TPA: hypothetical protein [Caudoviricetes sp.]
MTYTFDDIDELDDFIIDLMRSGGTGYFRGTEVRCDHRLGGRDWIMYGPRTTSFTADIGPDDLDYACEKLIAAGILDTPRA